MVTKLDLTQFDGLPLDVIWMEKVFPTMIGEITADRAKIAKQEAVIAELVEALRDLAEAVTTEVNEKGGGGYILARLSDARTALANKEATPPMRDWKSDAHLENGNYQCRCGVCGENFIGYKRRMTCRACWLDLTLPDCTPEMLTEILARKQPGAMIVEWKPIREAPAKKIGAPAEILQLWYPGYGSAKGSCYLHTNGTVFASSGEILGQQPTHYLSGLKPLPDGGAKPSPAQKPRG